MRSLAVGALFFVMACKSVAPAPTDAGAAATATTADGGGDAATATLSDDDTKRVVKAWSDALDQHNVDALASLYGDPVFYYTASRSKASVLAVKKAALGPDSTFHQSIVGDIVVSDGGHRATFTKRSGNGTKLANTKAVLVLDGSPLVITEERDAPRPPASCEDTVWNVSKELPPVQKAMAPMRKELAKYPDRREGGIGPSVEDDGTWSGAIGVMQPERFEPIATFRYSPKGVYEVTVMGDTYSSDPKAVDKAHLIAATETAKLKAACGH